MPQVEVIKRPRLSKEKRLFVVGGSLLVVVAIVAAVVVAKTWPTTPKVSTETAIDSAEDKRFDGDVNGAITVLKRQLKEAEASDDKQSILMALGGAYESRKTTSDYKTALSYYQQAAKLGAGFGTNNAIARAAAASGEKDMAIEYYRKNKELILSGNAPQHGGDLPEVEAALKELGAM